MIKLFTFIFSLLLLCGCSAPKEQKASSDKQGEVIITGQIKNRDFYPHVNEIVLHLPFFREGKVTYTRSEEHTSELQSPQ